MEKKLLIQNLKKEMEKSLLLETADKQYWLQNLETFPELMLSSFYNFLKPKNDLVDEAIMRTLRQNPDALPDLKNKIAKIKRTLQELEENEEKNTSSVNLEEQLKNL